MPTTILLFSELALTIYQLSNFQDILKYIYKNYRYEYVKEFCNHLFLSSLKLHKCVIDLTICVSNVDELQIKRIYIAALESIKNFSTNFEISNYTNSSDFVLLKDIILNIKMEIYSVIKHPYEYKDGKLIQKNINYYELIQKLQNKIILVVQNLNEEKNLIVDQI